MLHTMFWYLREGVGKHKHLVMIKVSRKKIDEVYKIIYKSLLNQDIARKKLSSNVYIAFYLKAKSAKT